MRDLALAASLADAGWRCVFGCSEETPIAVPALSRSGFRVAPLGAAAALEPRALRALWPEGCELLVVDHYGLDVAYESECRPWARRILVIDDLADRRHDADVLLDPTLGRSADDYAALVPEGCEILTGPRFALLRSAFAAARTAALDGRERACGRLLVALGVTDPGNLTETVLEGIAASGLVLAVDVVLGSSAPHLRRVLARARAMPQPTRVLLDAGEMAALMCAADLAIGAAGGTAWERCCLGLASITVTVAENQRPIADALVRAGVVESLGPSAGLTPEAVRAALVRLATDSTTRLRMARAAAAVCDGLGADRVLRVLTRFAETAGGV